MRFSRSLPALLLAAATVFSHAQPEPALTIEPGISRALAQARAARLSDIRYALSFTLVPKSPTTSAQETLTFTDTGSGDLPLDFRDGEIQSATLNTTAIPTTNQNGHLILPAAALTHGPNRLEVTFTANIAPAGKAITRYQDKDDGNEYLYTLFVPADADMAFPCFDQPDLKARFTLTVSHPTPWSIVSNTTAAVIPESGTLSQTTFPETQPISTYLFAFAAGPFARLATLNPREPTLYVRASQFTRARQEAPEVQHVAAQGIAYLSDYFNQPFPFPKYDLVLIPGFPFGGMEHAGATFLNEDGVLFRSTPTASDYFRRDILVLHETTHQWFGDLVTMRWFDDLWLKEGFAQYMAYKAMAQLKPETQPWKHFNEDIKPLAYAIDETQGTTPIFQNIPNLKDAKSAYGAIVYQKAPAILKQLNFKLGEEVFRNGLRFYLKEHAYGSATWSDLITAFHVAGGVDTVQWANGWINQRGLPQIEASYLCEDGKIKALTLVQKDSLQHHSTWHIDNVVLLDYGTSQQRIRADWQTPTYVVTEALGKPCPNFLFSNDQDQAYGLFPLDFLSSSFLTASGSAAVNITKVGDDLLRSQLYTALWQNVRSAKSPPAAYIDLTLSTLPTEPDESLNRIQGGRIAEALHFYLAPASRQALLPQAEAVIADRMLHAPTLGLRITNFRTFTSIAETPAARAQLKQLLAGTLTIAGLTLKPLDRWTLIGHLLSLNDPDALKLFAAEAAHDQSGEAKKYAYAALAATPDPTIKARYFADYQTANVQEDWLTQSLRSFNSYNQQPLTLPYLQQALNQLPNIKRNRKIFFLGAWLSAFLDGQSTPQAQAIVHQWLAQPNIDPDLRLKVLEVSDALDRTVAIRTKYPN